MWSDGPDVKASWSSKKFCFFLTLTGLFLGAYRFVMVINPNLAHVEKNPVPLVIHEYAVSTNYSFPKCEKNRAVDRIAFVKTHKTGSTTLASILERFGYLHNLSFILPSKKTHIMSSVKRFNREMVVQAPVNLRGNRDSYEMLTNHVRFDKREILAKIPNAKIITVLRDPAKQLESVFGYFETAKHVMLPYFGRNNALEKFMQRPEFYVKKHFYFWFQMWNGQIYDLGLDNHLFKNQTAVSQKLSELAEEIDFALINEYFDQSLLVLKKMFCWSIEDILYISKGLRSKSHRYSVNNKLRQKLLKWNRIDVFLYDHFNQSLWKKIESYGDNFDRDLTEFRERLSQTKNTCISKSAINKKDKREDKYVLKKNSSLKCKLIFLGDVELTRTLRKKQNHANFTL